MISLPLNFGLPSFRTYIVLVFSFSVKICRLQQQRTLNGVGIASQSVAPLTAERILTDCC